MLHQPTPRTDLLLWAEDTTTVIDMIDARVVIVSDPFMAAVPVLENAGIRVVTVEQLLAADPTDSVETGEDELAMMQLTSARPGLLRRSRSPTATWCPTPRRCSSMPGTTSTPM